MMRTIQKIKIDNNWSFDNVTRKETSYVTHGYHSYPAKFIPQLASKLIQTYSKKGQVVCDPFSGCGTTMVESILSERSFIGTDINPVAVMISKAKKESLNPGKIEKKFAWLEKELTKYKASKYVSVTNNERINYWFKKANVKKLDFLLGKIDCIEDTKLRNFFYCAFSNTLKLSSFWLQRSNKPTKDYKKETRDPFSLFKKQVRRMSKQNEAFWHRTRELNDKNFHKIFKRDACDTGMRNNCVNLIVTSPPYVTSYEYADLHQLSMLWFDYVTDVREIRDKFIGTVYKKDNIDNSVYGERALKTLNKLGKVDRRLENKVGTYFCDMFESFEEMYRILKRNGMTCIVIGDTKLKGIHIRNSSVFVEQLQRVGFKVKKIIKRKIHSKNLPSVRDKKTGKFTSLKNKNQINVYKYEYIIIAQK